MICSLVKHTKFVILDQTKQTVDRSHRHFEVQVTYWSLWTDGCKADLQDQDIHFSLSELSIWIIDHQTVAQ